ncbi:hypothetical protein OIU85_023355 [Salix viminalis]|uniref:Uncharacterized protein n=1 Tax=Salix viminalis TaxID=40686 RepID=A0A9Q0TYG7_SALVM|nr:hypothetical protein OIU85_023355 [Salix viminalis]
MVTVLQTINAAAHLLQSVLSVQTKCTLDRWDSPCLNCLECGVSGLHMPGYHHSDCPQLWCSCGWKKENGPTPMTSTPLSSEEVFLRSPLFATTNLGMNPLVLLCFTV